MRKVTLGILIASGLVASALAFATLLGLGTLRDGNPWAVSLSASLLVLLPAAGLAGTFRHRPEGIALSLLIWPILLLVGIPLYFPGERPQAMATGFAIVAAAGSPEAAEVASRFGRSLGERLGDGVLEGTPPPPPAPPVPKAPQQQVAPLPDEAIVLPAEGEGRSLRIPVIFDGARSAEFWMTYDTGATFTTLNRAALDELGVRVPPDAPTVLLDTAGGQREASLVLLEAAWLGGLAVKGVTVAICEECAGDNHSGLLGLNVSGQFTITVDPRRHELVITPQGEDVDRHLDVAQWVEVSGTVTAWSDGRRVVEVEARNTANRPVDEMQVGIRCGDRSWEGRLQKIGPRGVGRTRVSLPGAADCSDYRINVLRAHW